MRARHFFFVLVCAVSFGLTAKSLPAQSLPLESISLLCDREIYLSGEVLFFSANVSQTFETDIPLSTTLYIEVLDGKGKPAVAQKHVITAEGHCHGSLELPSILPTGAYFVRAYTQYQKNLPPESHTTKLILLANPDEGIASIPVAIESVLAFRFDSGSPIAGLSNLLVVRSKSPASLQIVDEQNKSTGDLLHQVGSYQLWEVPIEGQGPLRIISSDSTRVIPETSFPPVHIEGIMASLNTTESIISAVF